MTTPIQRQIFINDVENAFEALCLNMAHIDKPEAMENIMTILHALRIAADTYEEYALQKRIEEVLALMLNHRYEHNTKIVSRLYHLTEEMIYPYKERMLTL